MFGEIRGGQGPDDRRPFGQVGHRGARRIGQRPGPPAQGAERGAAALRRADPVDRGGDGRAAVRGRERHDRAERGKRRVVGGVDLGEEQVDHHPALAVGQEVDLPARSSPLQRAELLPEGDGGVRQVALGVAGPVAAAVVGVGVPVDLVGTVPEAAGSRSTVRPVGGPVRLPMRPPHHRCPDPPCRRARWPATGSCPAPDPRASAHDRAEVAPPASSTSGPTYDGRSGGPGDEHSRNRWPDAAELRQVAGHCGAAAIAPSRSPDRASAADPRAVAAALVTAPAPPARPRPSPATTPSPRARARRSAAAEARDGSDADEPRTGARWTRRARSGGPNRTVGST